MLSENKQVITLNNQIKSLGYELVYETSISGMAPHQKEDLIEKLYSIKIVETEIESEKQEVRRQELEARRQTGK